MGVNGKWSLLWLEVSALTSITTSEALRESLLTSLSNNLRNPGPRFAPVYDVNEMPESMHKETGRLDQQFTKLVMPALICDSKRGALYPVPTALNSHV